VLLLVFVTLLCSSFCLAGSRFFCVVVDVLGRSFFVEFRMVVGPGPFYGVFRRFCFGFEQERILGGNPKSNPEKVVTSVDNTIIEKSSTRQFLEIPNLVCGGFKSRHW
jgi:hypothetical protein